jgi:membrane-bound metal-dependent hydrolase YbcI (DUF457 family)
MPITPFHFGPGAALHALAPRHVSFLAFCAANVLIDVEPLYFMLTRQYPLHRFFHTFVGASLIAAATVGLFVVARWLALRLRVPDVFGWQRLGLLPVTLGAAAGSWSHVVLDSLMHRDMAPWAPFSQANPLLHAVSLGSLHGGCLLAGIGAVIILGIRRMMRTSSSKARP